MNITGRWPALVLIPAAVAAMVVIDDGYDRPEPDALEVPLAAQGVGPVAAGEDVVSSTWYCAGGTADATGSADHVVRVGNVGSQDLLGAVTAIPNLPEAIEEPEPDPVEQDPSTSTTGPDATTPTTTTTTVAAPSTTLPPPSPEAVVPIEVPAGETVEVRLADHVESSFAAGWDAHGAVSAPNAPVTVCSTTAPPPSSSTRPA
ncbi:MAG: hypothetical protein AAGK32_20190, partial [Actinomycetota bacterium]